MSDELEVLHDSNALPLSEQDIEILEQVDDFIHDALVTKDITSVISFGRRLIRGFRIRGVVLSKLLYELVTNWDNFGVEDDYISVITNEMGVKIVTLVKYSNMWRTVFAESGISDAIKQRLLCKPVKSLLLLPALIEDGDVNWDEIIDADTHEDLRDLIREKRGLVTSSKTALFIKLDSRTGQLSCKAGDTPFTPFGLFNLQLAETNLTVAHAIERICRDARILR